MEVTLCEEIFFANFAGIQNCASQVEQSFQRLQRYLVNFIDNRIFTFLKQLFNFFSILKIFFKIAQSTFNFNFVGKYSIGNWDLSATWVYATGKPYTAPESQYYLELLDGNSQSYIHVSDKNTYHLPAYHRLDVGLSRSFYTDSNKFVLGFSIFNLYNNENVWYRQYDLDTQPITVTDVKMLGATPTVYLQVYSR